MVDHVHSSSCNHDQPDDQWDQAMDADVESAVNDIQEVEDSLALEHLRQELRAGKSYQVKHNGYALPKAYSGKVQNPHDPRYVRPQAPQWNLRPTRMAMAVNAALYGHR